MICTTVVTNEYIVYTQNKEKWIHQNAIESKYKEQKYKFVLDFNLQHCCVDSALKMVTNVHPTGARKHLNAVHGVYFWSQWVRKRKKTTNTRGK